MVLRGSARCTGSSGLGDTAAYIPAGGGTVRGANSASRTMCCLRGAQSEYGACAHVSPWHGIGRKSIPLPSADYGSHHGT